MELASFARSDDRAPQQHPVGDMIRELVLETSRSHPRSQQRQIGPSEVGEPCARRLAYRLMNEPRCNEDSDPWPSIVGTATHAWLADAFTAANKRLGRIRYLVETRVKVEGELAGSCDLYDADLATVIDHKVVGESKMREYKRNGPSGQYRSQAHLYGYGLAKMGLPVRHVALAFYPRGGMLSGLHVWSEPYDEAVARAALERLFTVTEAIVALDVEHDTGRYAYIPAEPGHRCSWCPWWSPGNPVGATCPGHMPPEGGA